MATMNQQIATRNHFNRIVFNLSLVVIVFVGCVFWSTISGALEISVYLAIHALSVYWMDKTHPTDDKHIARQLIHSRKHAEAMNLARRHGEALQEARATLEDIRRSYSKPSGA